jgi:hypothetical protein
MGYGSLDFHHDIMADREIHDASFKQVTGIGVQFMPDENGFTNKSMLM